MRVKLGILKTDAVRPEWVPEHGEYPDMFMALLRQVDPDLQFRVYDVQEGQYPTDIDEVDAYLMTGSKSSAYDEKAWIFELMGFVRELHQRKKKLLGICFGHQLIAQALGGLVERSHKGWGVGVHSYQFAATPEWHDQGDSSFDLLASHQDQVVTTSAETQVLAGSAFCENAVCQIADHILTFQGHPEFSPGYAGELMTLRRERIGEATYEAGMASLEQETQGNRVAQWMLNFLAT